MKILIATPTYDARLDLVYVHSLLHTIDILRSHGHQVSYFAQPNALVERARNLICQRFLELEADYVWMIDYDTGWGEDATRTMLTMMESGEKFIAGAPPRRSYPIRFTVRLQKGEPSYAAGCRVLTCETAPVAFSCVHRDVFKAIEGMCAEYEDGGRRLRMFFEQRRVEGRLLGEDEFFSLVVRKAGIRLLCPIDMKLIHRGAHEFVASLGEEWDRSVEGAEA